MDDYICILAAFFNTSIGEIHNHTVGENRLAKVVFAQVQPGVSTIRYRQVSLYKNTRLVVIGWIGDQ